MEDLLPNTVNLKMQMKDVLWMFLNALYIGRIFEQMYRKYKYIEHGLNEIQPYLLNKKINNCAYSMKQQFIYFYPQKTAKGQ